MRERFNGILPMREKGQLNQEFLKIKSSWKSRVLENQEFLKIKSSWKSRVLANPEFFKIKSSLKSRVLANQQFLKIKSSWKSEALENQEFLKLKNVKFLWRGEGTKKRRGGGGKRKGVPWHIKVSGHESFRKVLNLKKCLPCYLRLSRWCLMFVCLFTEPVYC